MATFRPSHHLLGSTERSYLAALHPFFHAGNYPSGLRYYCPIQGCPGAHCYLEACAKNALLPIVTILGLDFVAIMGGSIATETLFSMPGLGSQLIQSIRMKDVPMVMGGVLVLAFACAVIVLLVDILYAFIDPRIKAKYSKKA